MFKKDFNVKSNCSLKSSDKRKFVALLQEKFKINDCINLKNIELHHVKIVTFSDQLCELYLVDKVPWVFLFEDKCFPTVYFLWKYPECLFTFTIAEPVLEKVQAGADVMLPGFIIDGEVNVTKLGRLEKGDICAVRLLNSKAPVAVGTANISSTDMLECGLRGKGIRVTHFFGDFLWKMGPKDRLPIIPLSAPVSEPDQLDLQNRLSLEDLDLTNVAEVLPADSIVNEQADNEQPDTSGDQNDDGEQSVSVITDTFVDYFLLAAKLNLKQPTDFPILVSTFQGKYLSSMIKDAGLADRINIQKTEYKKFSNFLQKMQDAGVLKVEEKQKGVQQIVSVNFQHEMFGRITRNRCSIEKPEKIQPGDKKTKSADFKEMFSITANVLPFVQCYRTQAKKGDAISAPDIRQMMTDYVKTENLIDLADSKVHLDPLLAKCLNRTIGEALAWSKLFEYLFSCLQPCFEFHFADGSAGLKKGKPPSILISTAKRSGNKKVILINNVSALGVDPVLLSKDLQVRLAASAVVHSDAPMHVSQGPQVQVQGSNVKAVIDLLLEKYGVPKNSVKQV